MKVLEIDSRGTKVEREMVQVSTGGAGVSKAGGALIEIGGLKFELRVWRDNMSANIAYASLSEVEHDRTEL